MKRLSVEKLKLIIKDFEDNNINFIDSDKMKNLYDTFGDTVYYDRDYGRMDITQKGNEYIKIKNRQ